MVDVPVSVLRAELRSWIERAGEGEDIVITERGVPVARLAAVSPAPDLLADLARAGVLTVPTESRASVELPAAEAAGRTLDEPAHEARGVQGLVRRLRW